MDFKSIDEYFEGKKNSELVEPINRSSSPTVYRLLSALVNYSNSNFPDMYPNSGYSGLFENAILVGAQSVIRESYGLESLGLTGYYANNPKIDGLEKLMDFRQQTINYILKKDLLFSKAGVVNNGDFVIINESARGTYSQTVPGSEGMIVGRLEDTNRYTIAFTKLGSTVLSSPSNFDRIERRYFDKIVSLPKDEIQKEQFAKMITDNALLASANQIISRYVSDNIAREQVPHPG